MEFVETTVNDDKNELFDLKIKKANCFFGSLATSGYKSFENV